VYTMMMSKDALAHCLPGCENLEEIGEDAYRATLKIGIAGIKGTYTCTIRTTEKVPLETWTLTIEGQAKTGNVKGVGRFTLTAADEGTEVSYDGDADIMGPLAGIGQRMMAPASRTIIGKFFECMSGQLPGSSAQP
ncbi:MAG: carbon monoxide dehydrogenase subunit G, partial [Thermomicrobia bacterium]|nr:carbon monoxide dehydrogenase subunit G [Thermomicrobia bacterium]